MKPSVVIAKTARPIGVKPLNEKEMAAKYANRVRKGKTAKDKAKRPKQEEVLD